MPRDNSEEPTDLRLDGPRPMPVVDPDTQTFWEAARRHILVVQQCPTCGRLRFPPTPMCPGCRDWNDEWTVLDGNGKVFSWVVAWHPVTEGLKQEVPYVVALVEVAPGLRFPARLMGCGVDHIWAGMPVSVDFVDLDEQITLPTFRPGTPSSSQSVEGTTSG